MELLILKHKGMWAAQYGKYGVESPIIPLVSASRPLYRLITAIKNVYPDAIVWVDPASIENPFMQRRLATYQRFNLHLGMGDFAEIQYALDNPRIKECSLCHGRAYYNTEIRGWVCSKCGAHEDFYDEARFFKLSRNAGRTRMH